MQPKIINLKNIIKKKPDEGAFTLKKKKATAGTWENCECVGILRDLPLSLVNLTPR